MFSSLNLNTIKERELFIGFVLTVLICIALYIYTESKVVFVLPALMLGVAFIADDYRRLFYGLFVILPFTSEFYFEGAGIGTDLPSEPMMIALTGFALVTMMNHKFSFHKVYVIHPIFILILVHIFWILVTGLQSTYFLISFKFLLAKIWYVIPFFFLPLFMLDKGDDFLKIYNILYKFLFVTLSIILFRHALEGFSFESTYRIVQPFFRNHVTYAAITVVCLPFVWAFYRINRDSNASNKWLKYVFILFVIAIYFSFTRAAILSMLIAVGAYYIIKYRYVKAALGLSTLVATVGIIFLSWNNKYLDFAPNFEKTITHYEFDNLIEATYKLEDISSMERVYRWMAGIEMIKDKFWLGFGPGTFYSNYKAYSISRFQTYVSDNPDQSGIHNYFLMTWVEQGFIGFLILIALCFLMLMEGENVYHRATLSKDRYVVMAATLGLIVIFAMCLINDLIETDKVGPFFFLNAAIILFYHKKYPKTVES